MSYKDGYDGVGLIFNI